MPPAEIVAPVSQEEVAEVVARAARLGDAALSHGWRARALRSGCPRGSKDRGWRRQTSRSVVDYPARDMTITVEAGITMRELAAELAAQGQRLPIDAPAGWTMATLGGVVATATSGPRRYGQGTIRDYVIGISAVDGRGVPFKAGGRVVKNVAGYDFCKLLTGSRGRWP